MMLGRNVPKPNQICGLKINMAYLHNTDSCDFHARRLIRRSVC